MFFNVNAINFIVLSFINKLMLYRYIIAFATIILFSRCNTDGNDKPSTPNVSNIPISIDIQRFDKAIQAIDTANTEGGITALEKAFPEFSKIYFEKIIGLKDVKDTVNMVYRKEFRKFITDPAMRHMIDTIVKAYPNFDVEKSQIEQGLRYFKHYFPKHQVPTTIYTMPSAYNFAAVLPSDNTVAIGLDMFLGADFTDYEALASGQYPRFISRTFRRDYIVDRVFELLVGDIAGEPQGNRLLDYMIHNGKKLYVLDCLLPTTPDSIKLNYTKEQMSGTYANENYTWNAILKQNLLYSTSFQSFQKVVMPSPTAPIIAAEAPGGVGNFIGWQIVKQYMKQQPNTSLEELLAIKDAQKILDISKYKPKK